MTLRCCDAGWAVSVAGVSRSVTLVVAYIMTVTGRGWVESLAAVRAARPCAGPNLGFLRQLEEFENAELREVSRQPSAAPPATRLGGRRTDEVSCTHLPVMSFQRSPTEQ